MMNARTGTEKGSNTRKGGGLQSCGCKPHVTQHRVHFRQYMQYCEEPMLFSPNTLTKCDTRSTI